MTKDGEKHPLQFIQAQSVAVRCLIMSDQQCKTQKYLIYTEIQLRKRENFTLEKLQIFGIFTLQMTLTNSLMIINFPVCQIIEFIT